MASGTIDCLVQSVDYGGTIGHIKMKSYFNWEVVNNVLTVTYVRSEDIKGGANTWGICSSNTSGTYGIYAKAQYSTDNGATWYDLPGMQGLKTVSYCWTPCAQCSETCHQTSEGDSCLTNVYQTMSYAFGQFGSVELSQSGLLRLLYGANAAPAPSASLPHAFPSYAQTGAYQIPVYIEVDYRPGAVRKNGVFKSTDNDGGACHILKNSSWTEMRTQEGGTGVNDPPSIRRSGAWKNQNKIGA